LAQAATPNLPSALGPLLAALRGIRPQLPLIVAVLLAIGAGTAGARLVWRSVDLFAPPPMPTAALAPTPRLDPLALAERLAAAEPFGVAAGDAATSDDAPETRLALQLRGVIAAADAKHSRAFIAGSDGEERGYALGATLPGGALLHAVHPDRVVLRRGAALEVLRLPREGAGLTDGDAPVGSISAAEVREAQVNPSRLLELMRVAVATEGDTGRQLGYRVYPGREPERFAKLGLQAGDLVTALNGIALDDPVRSMDLMRGLGDSDQITLTVERDGTQRLVQVPFTR